MPVMTGVTGFIEIPPAGALQELHRLTLVGDMAAVGSRGELIMLAVEQLAEAVLGAPLDRRAQSGRR